MRRLWFQFVFRLTTDDNWRWLALAGLTGVLFIFCLMLLPYAFTQPETNYERGQRELYEFAARVRGESGSWVPPAVHDAVGGLMQGVARFFFGLFVLSFLATVIYFFPAFWDDLRRAVAAVRVRMWDRYGTEIHRSNFLTRWFLGQSAPSGSSPSAAPAAGQQPLTKPAFLFWEAIIDLGNEFLGHKLWGGR